VCVCVCVCVYSFLKCSYNQLLCIHQKAQDIKCSQNIKPGKKRNNKTVKSSNTETRRCYAHVGRFWSESKHDEEDKNDAKGKREWKLHTCHFSDHSVDTIVKDYIQRGVPLVIRGLGPALYGDKILAALGHIGPDSSEDSEDSDDSEKKKKIKQKDESPPLPSTRDVLEYLSMVAGTKRVGIYCKNKASEREGGDDSCGKKDPLGGVCFAKLEEYCRHLMDNHIDKKANGPQPSTNENAGNTDDETNVFQDTIGHYLYDVSLKKQLPILLDDFRLPRYIQKDFLQRTMRRHYFVESWPTLFVASPDTKSTLHIDQWHGSFWMVQVAGSKRWTMFHPDDYSNLDPIYHPDSINRAKKGNNSEKVKEEDGNGESEAQEPMRAAFRDLREMEKANVESDGKAHPRLSSARRVEVVLTPGDLLFVPGGTPHFVENLGVTVAYAGNFVDAGNYRKAVHCDLFHMAKRGGVYETTHRALSEVCFEDDEDENGTGEGVQNKKESSAADYTIDYFDDYSGLQGMMP